MSVQFMLLLRGYDVPKWREKKGKTVRLLYGVAVQVVQDDMGFRYSL